jgi:hypothetical protein
VNHKRRKEWEMTVRRNQDVLIHWNYFLALEEDLEKISRYVEFDTENLQTYSIEFAHLLLASSSEVDVILKEISSLIDPSSKAQNINDYRKAIKTKLTPFISEGFINEKVYIPRFNLDFNPWSNWHIDTNPNWWVSYNNVKHRRNKFFSEANLQNVLNSLGALLITTVYYYWFKSQSNINTLTKKQLNISKRNFIKHLTPQSNFIMLHKDYYPVYIIG